MLLGRKDITTWIQDYNLPLTVPQNDVVNAGYIIEVLTGKSMDVVYQRQYGPCGQLKFQQNKRETADTVRSLLLNTLLRSVRPTVGEVPPTVIKIL